MRMSSSESLVAYLFGLLFYSSLALITLLVLPSLLIILILLSIALLVLQSMGQLQPPHPITFSRELTDLLEQTALSTISSLKITSSWDKFHFKVSHHDVEIDLHSLHCPSSEENCPARTLLWIHGTGSSAAISFGMNSIFDRLHKSYHVYAIDLPGFGRSSAPTSISEFSSDELEDLFTETIHLFMERKSISKVTLVAHSIGAFFAINFAHK